MLVPNVDDVLFFDSRCGGIGLQDNFPGGDAFYIERGDQAGRPADQVRDVGSLDGARSYLSPGAVGPDPAHSCSVRVDIDKRTENLARRLDSAVCRNFCYINPYWIVRLGELENMAPAGG